MNQKFKTLRIILLSIGIMILLFAVFIGIGSYFQSIGQKVVGNTCIVLFLFVTFMAVKIFNKKVNQLNPGSYGFHFNNFVINILIGFSLAIIITVITLIAAKLLFGIPVEFLAIKPGFEKPLFLLIISTIGIGLWEEFYFRGLIYNTLLKNTFGFHISAFISAILFSIIHWSSFDMSETSLLWYLGIVFIGYILAFIYTISDSIWSVVSFHFIWNSLARFLDNQENEIGLFEIPNYSEYSKTMDIIMVIVLGLVLLLILFLTRVKTVSDRINSYIIQINSANSN